MDRFDRGYFRISSGMCLAVHLGSLNVEEHLGKGSAATCGCEGIAARVGGEGSIKRTMQLLFWPTASSVDVSDARDATTPKRSERHILPGGACE